MEPQGYDNEHMAPGVSRRDVMRLPAIAGAAAVIGQALPRSARAAGRGAAQTTADTAQLLLAGAPSGAPAVASTFTPVRPPATPLVVRSPYLSTWLPADNLPGTWPAFWTGHVTAMTGIVRVDGVAYTFMGAPGLAALALRGAVQYSLDLTATRSRFGLKAGGVALTVTFLSPIEPGDLRRQSMPLSYVIIDASSDDGQPHRVSIYVDISGEWAHGNTGTPIVWSQEDVGGSGQSLVSLTNAPASPQPLTEAGDMAAWGTVVWSTAARPGLTWQIGADQIVRSAAATAGALANTVDQNQPRPINDNWPVFAFNLDLGTLTGPAGPMVISIGHVRDPAVSYLGTPLPPLWKSYWPSWQAMAAFFHADCPAAQQRCGALDAKIRVAATRAAGAAGEQYAALCALALRQAYGGTELVSRNGTPWAFLKEISSDGNVSTIDVTYPGSPVFLYADPAYLGLLLAPLLDYPENGGWPKQFAEHDLGSHYPVAAGHNDGNEEDMPVEESANMLIMSAAYVARAGSAAGSFATAHYRILKQWADYLVANALDPGFQNQTDDFTGFIAHSVNLALKGIIGIGAMSQIATAAGNAADASHYLGVARGYITQWAAMAQDNPASGSPAHLKLAYDQPGTWSLKYNGYPDALLGLGLVPASVAAQEAAWYAAQENQFGVPLDIRHSYTKTDWELWTAAWLRGQPIRDFLISSVYNFADTTPSRVPFTDWYDTVNDRQVGFQARPVIGGVFALLTLPLGS